MSPDLTGLAARFASSVGAPSAAQWLVSQGAMEVISKQLDDAFADTDVKPRQRLESVEIDYAVGQIDCARVTFLDPDGRVARAIRLGSKTPGDLQYSLWTARIGYAYQPIEEWTTLTGVPTMEAPVFPAAGTPKVTIKIFSPVVALKKNKTPGGGVEEYLLASGATVSPLRQTLQAIADFYSLELYLGDSGMDEIVTAIDKGLESYMNLEHLDRASSREALDEQMFGRLPASGSSAPKIDPSLFAPEWGRAPRDKNDAAYLQRISSRLTQLVQAGMDGAEPRYAAYFNEKLLGKVAKGDLVVATGVYDNKLLFCFTRDYLKLTGVDKIPVVDYRSGNNLLIDFSPQAAAAKDQGGFLALIFKGSKREEFTPQELAPIPFGIDTGAISSEDIGKSSVNTLQPDKFMTVVRQPTNNAISSAQVDLDVLKRHLDTDLKGMGHTYGNRYWVAGNLVCLNGLGWGIRDEIKEGAEGEAQLFASHNRIYFLNRATHSMDSAGFYKIEFEVQGCSLDGGDDKARSNFIKRLKQGIEMSGGTSWWQGIFDYLGAGG